jgi:hypothetical protein
LHVCGGAKIGKGVSLGQNVFIGNKVVIGDKCKIQNNVSVYDNVTLEEGVFCGPSMVFTNVYNPRSFIERKNEYKTTRVKKGATIGANATIICGVTIGEYAFIGAGAVVRDARKITMSNGESKLEAKLAEKEFRDSQFEYFKKENAKSGLGNLVTEDQLKKIDTEASSVYNNVYQGNFGLIYATNAITFDNMFKNMKATNFLAKDLYSVLRKKGSDLVSVEVLKNTAMNAVKNQLGKITWKSALDFSLSSSMEGLQEVGQDWISGSVQSYRARNVQGKQLRGGFLTYLEQDLKDAAYKSYKDGSGLEAYLSGALMGVFAGPVGFATGRVNNYLFNGGINKTYQYVANNEEYQKQKLKLEEQGLLNSLSKVELFKDAGGAWLTLYIYIKRISSGLL